MNCSCSTKQVDHARCDANSQYLQSDSADGEVFGIRHCFAAVMCCSSTGVEHCHYSTEKTREGRGGDVKSDVGGEKPPETAGGNRLSEIERLACRLASMPPEAISVLQQLFDDRAKQ
jgi:hypothetical protein